jgi:hypothetical protein
MCPFLFKIIFNDALVATIDLSDKNIESSETRALAEALNTFSTLKDYDIHYNKISDEGAKYISDALKTNTTLTGINLSYNYISVDSHIHFRCTQN